MRKERLFLTAFSATAAQPPPPAPTPPPCTAADDGAKKRFGTYFNGFPLVVCAKVRAGGERIVHVADGDPKGRHCLIVDDLVQSGGTLRACKDMLLQVGTACVRAACVW